MTPAIFGLAGPVLTDDERDFFRDAEPAGYILFARNCENRDQLRALTDSLKELSGAQKVLISIDQEGGRVARMKPPEWDRYPAGDLFAQLWDIAPASAIEAARINAEVLAQDLAEVGINVNYHAPFDVRQPGASDVIGDRALGSEAMQVAALGRAVLDGHAKAGVAGCLKHMPGHGRALVDSHKDLPVVTVGEAELEEDIRPFATLADRASIGMSAHIIYTAWDSDNPATQSATVIDKIIRGRIGFDGLLLTDDIDMEALTGSIGERSRKSLDAGCDLVLNCWARMNDMLAIAEACEPLGEKGRERLAKALDLTGAESSTGDRVDLIAKRDALFASAGLEGVAA